MTEAEIDALRAAFDDGTLPRESWTHAAHLTVAANYVLDDSDTALDRMRAGIRALNRVHGTADTETSGFHETLTGFWIAILRAFCRTQAQFDRLKFFNKLIASFPSSYWREFYSYDVVQSREARASWVAPDLKPLP
jgi:hypothetical protein